MICAWSGEAHTSSWHACCSWCASGAVDKTQFKTNWTLYFVILIFYIEKTVKENAKGFLVRLRVRANWVLRLRQFPSWGASLAGCSVFFCNRFGSDCCNGGDGDDDFHFFLAMFPWIVSLKSLKTFASFRWRLVFSSWRLRQCFLAAAGDAQVFLKASLPSVLAWKLPIAALRRQMFRRLKITYFQVVDILRVSFSVGSKMLS